MCVCVCVCVCVCIVYCIPSVKGGLLILGSQTGCLFEGGGLIEGERLFNFPSQSKKKPKPNTYCIDRFSINGVIVDRKYNMASLNQLNILLQYKLMGTVLRLIPTRHTSCGGQRDNNYFTCHVDKGGLIEWEAYIYFLYKALGAY